MHHIRNLSPYRLLHLHLTDSNAIQSIVAFCIESESIVDTDFFAARCFDQHTKLAARQRLHRSFKFFAFCKIFQLIVN
jgi:hypothetical protein